ncbi:MAG: VWA domain-containing protein [Gammaproteobacteria bacterium]|nr:VWA domain-containing protein [Gammaproteobacteria bacterium]
MWERWQEFHFLRPFWLLLLPILAGLLVWWWQHRRQAGSWSAVVEPQLLPHLLTHQMGKASSWPLVAMMLAGVLMILALAGPAWQRLSQPLFRQQSALVILWDLSRSMLSTDLSPNRLQKARFKLLDLLHQRKEGQTALVVFAGSAYTVTPLTEDVLTIEAMLSSLHPDLMPNQGSRPELAIAKAVELFQQGGILHGQVLLLTDSDTLAAVTAARELKKSGHRLSVLAVGTVQGAPIPRAQGGFIKDAQGNIVLPGLNETVLRRVAAAGGGLYQSLSLGDQDLQRLQSLWISSHKEMSESQAQFDQWQEEGPWLLLLVLPLAALVFRRGYLLLLVFLVPYAPPSSALSWDELWLNQEQQAKQAFDQGQFERAGKGFSDPNWRGAADYRAGKFEQSLQNWQSSEGAQGFYNRGNALARLGKLPEAVKAYEEALKKQPEFEDAEFNLAQVKAALKKQQQEQQQKQDKDKQQQDGDQEQSNDQQQGSGGQQDQQSEQELSQSKQDQSQKPDAQNPSDSESQESEQQAEEKTSDQQSDRQTEPEKQSAESLEKAEAAEKEAEATEQQASQQQLTSEQQEQQLANEQWLRRIPDDPAGLLRRKFLYQYRQQDGQPTEQSW